MSALLTCSSTSLPIDTVPAIKIIHFNGVPKADQVYAYARLYALDGSLCFSLTRFEQSPPPTCKMGIVVSNVDDTGHFVFFSTSFNGENSLCIHDGTNVQTKLSGIKLQVTSGTDEQGWYFTVQGELSPKVLEAVNVVLQPNNVFLCNIFSYDITESAFGSAFKTPALNSIPTIQGVEPIVCVSY